MLAPPYSGGRCLWAWPCSPSSSACGRCSWEGSQPVQLSSLLVLRTLRIGTENLGYVCLYFVCWLWFWSLVVNSYRVWGSSSLFPNLSPRAADLLMVLFTLCYWRYYSWTYFLTLMFGLFSFKEVGRLKKNLLASVVSHIKGSSWL